jgi:hypothetical protein
MPIPSNVFNDAVRGFWNQRISQRQAQELLGKIDQGNRRDVIGGKQMDGFALAITNLLLYTGVSQDNIHIKKSLTVLPGFFRPTKTYDFLVVSDSQLKAVIELKSHIGPSFGNNFNNRAEEAMGSALDLWTAFREGAFGNALPPWVGYLIVLEDCPESRTPIKVSERHFPVFEDFKNSSYAKRYELFCRKMVRERHYNAACFLMADKNRTDENPNYIEPALDLSADTFLSSLLRHVVPM